MQQIIKAIDEQFTKGNFEEAKKSLLELYKNYSLLNEEEQCFVIDMLINLREHEKARLLLNQDCDNPNNNTGTEFYFKKLLYYGQFKVSEQSINSAMKLFQKVLQFIKANKEAVHSDSHKRMMSHLANNLRAIDDFKTIIELEQYFHYSHPAPVLDSFMRLEVIRAKIYFSNTFLNEYKEHYKKYKEELEQLTMAHPENKAYSATIRLFLLEIKLNFKDLTLLELKHAEEYLQESSLSPAQQQLASLLLGQSYFYLNQFKSASDYLQRTLNFCDCIVQKQAALFWLDKITPGSLNAYDYILMKCAPTLSIESFLSGNRFIEAPHYLTPFYSDLLKDSPPSPKENCWIISRNSVNQNAYNEIHLEGKCLDLKSGLYFNGKNTAILTDLRIRLLRLIISFGKDGAHQSYLIDALFDGTYYYYESAKLRLKNLVVELNKFGIKIKRKNNCYFFDFEKNPFPIIFPVNHNYHGPIAYLKKSELSLSRQIVEKRLNVKPSTASLYLKKWKDDGLIFKDLHQKYGEFSFTANSDVNLVG